MISRLAIVPVTFVRFVFVLAAALTSAAPALAVHWSDPDVYIVNPYIRCLGRAPTIAETTAWQRVMWGEHAEPEDNGPAVRDAICNSDEAKQYSRTLVKQAYERCLQRTPSDAEIDAWIATGNSNQGNQQMICNSQEAAEIRDSLQ